MTIQDILKNIQIFYASDPSTASLTLAQLPATDAPDSHRYYVSIVRYRERWGNGKEVVARQQSSTLELAVSECYAIWRHKIESEQNTTLTPEVVSDILNSAELDSMQ